MGSGGGGDGLIVVWTTAITRLQAAAARPLYHAEHSRSRASSQEMMPSLSMSRMQMRSE